MARSWRIRRLITLAPWTALVLGIGCGSGDEGPAGPGGGQGAESYELVSLGRIGLPADVAVEDCTLTRFYGGGLNVAEDGTWEIRLQVHDDIDGDWGYVDEGQIEDDGETVWFDSWISGSSYPATVNGTEMKLMYDWCYDGVQDVQLVFDR
jgi:hypothetical protein